MCCFVIVVLFSGISQASEIRYKPVNPSFGGNPFNSSYLLGTAEVQKQFDAPARERELADPLENFSNTLSRSLVTRLSRDITEAILGENAQDSGRFVVDGMLLNFERIDDMVSIVIQDPNGNQTQIELPAPQF